MSETEIEKLLWQRRSARAFSNQPVPKPDLERMLRAARRAPSGANLQPGIFHVLTGEALALLVQTLQAAIADGAPQTSEYSYFPDPLPTELRQRQRAAGYALYSALGIERRDVVARREQFERNYAFFDAPVGIVVTIDRAMGKGCFMDMGMSLMALLLAAEGLGYGATGIGALANYGPVVHQYLELPENELVVCGIAIGVVDQEHPANQVRTDRVALDRFSSFRGFTTP